MGVEEKSVHVVGQAQGLWVSWLVPQLTEAQRPVHSATCEPDGVETSMSIPPVWKHDRGLQITMFCHTVSKGDRFWLFFWIVVITRLCLVHSNKIQLQSWCWRGMLMSTSDFLKSWEQAGLAVSVKGVDEKLTILFFKTFTNVLISYYQGFLVPPFFLPSSLSTPAP